MVLSKCEGRPHGPLLICSGKSDRQVQAIAQGIAEALGELGIQPLGLEGMSEGKWVLMDYGDLVIHVFLEPIRQFYDLEGLWIDAPRIDLQKGVNLGESETESETESEAEAEAEAQKNRQETGYWIRGPWIVSKILLKEREQPSEREADA
jgi:ribosome silencing factor RsfS/YbeB/iojap